MHSDKNRIQMTVAVVLWTAVIACGAWLVASHGRKEYAELTSVEILDGFTPTKVRLELLLDGGSMIVTAAAKDGSYRLRLNQAFWDSAKVGEREVWLYDLGPVSTVGLVQPGSEMVLATQRNLQRALDAGSLDALSGRNARNVIALLGDHRAEVKWR